MQSIQHNISKISFQYTWKSFSRVQHFATPWTTQGAYSAVSDFLQPRGLQPTRLLRPWDFPGKNAGVGCHSSSRGSSQPRDQHRDQIRVPYVSHTGEQVLYHQCHLGSPRTTQSKEFSRSEHWSGQPFPAPEDLSNPEMEPKCPPLRTKSLPAEPPGRPENTGVGSLFHLWWIFLTQESNWGLLHCRRILQQLSYQENLNNKYYRSILFSFFHIMSSIPGVYFTLTIHLNLDAKF